LLTAPWLQKGNLIYRRIILLQNSNSLKPNLTFPAILKMNVLQALLDERYITKPSFSASITKLKGCKRIPKIGNLTHPPS